MKIIKDSIKILKLDANMLVKDYEVTNNRKSMKMKGSLPYSLLTIELQNLGEKFKYEKLTNSYNSYSIVSVNFYCDLKEISEENKEQFSYIVQGNKVYPKIGTKVKVMCSLELRKYIYKNGFTLIEEGKKVHYVQLCRSSSNVKNATGLFIREDLEKPVLHDFIRMGIKITEDELLDVPAWLTYESLPLSSIEDTININLENICVVDDVKINYQDIVSVTKFENGKLIQKDELHNIENTPADGLCLINKDLTKWCYLLLRNSFFKGAAISTDFELAKKELEKDFFVDIWGRKYECPDLIITPSCLKLFKFAYKFDSSLDMFEYWKTHCCKVFGIVKHNKHSGKHEGQYGQLSYQVLNSLYTATYSDVISIMSDELEFLKNLKTDECYFKLYSNLQKATFTDDFISTMTSLNNDFLQTDLYKNYKSNIIQDYIRYIKKSKIRVKKLDYFTIFGLPNVILREALGLTWNPDSVVGNVCYCSTYQLGQQLFSFRNPHVSPGNIVVLQNEYFSEDLRYFDKLDQGNVCILNTGRSSLMDSYSGCDNDGDTIALCPDEILIRLAKEIEDEGLFKAPVNTIPSTKLLKTLKPYDRAKIDHDISKNSIGEITNLAALLLSYIGSIYNENKKDERLKQLADLCNMMSVASGIEIDKAKKNSDVSAKDIIKFVKSELSYLFTKETIKVKKQELTEEEYKEYIETKNKDILKKEKKALVRPMFFKYAQSKYSSNYAFKKFNCPSDFVCDILDNFRVRNVRTKTIQMSELLIKNKTYEHTNRHQIQTIIDRLKNYKSDYCDILYSKGDALDKMIEKEKLHDNILEVFRKMNIKQDTIYCLLLRLFNENESEKMIKSSKNRELTEQGIIFLKENKNLLLEILFETHKKEFIECFQNFKQETEFLIDDEKGDIVIWGKKYRKEKI